MADAAALLTHLPPDTAAATLSWLLRHGKDVPVHIPIQTVRFAKECFILMDIDNSGTLEPDELQHVFQSLGQKVTLQQATALVESVAGKGAECLSFTQFAQMLHGALSAGSGQGAQSTERQLLQEAVNGGGKGGRGQQEAPVNLADMHLFAKAYRRRVIVHGIISNEEGWREKVMALAEKQDAKRRKSTAASAHTWKDRALGRRASSLSKLARQDSQGRGSSGAGLQRTGSLAAGRGEGSEINLAEAVLSAESTPMDEFEAAGIKLDDPTKQAQRRHRPLSTSPVPKAPPRSTGTPSQRSPTPQSGQAAPVSRPGSKQAGLVMSRLLDEATALKRQSRPQSCADRGEPRGSLGSRVSFAEGTRAPTSSDKIGAWPGVGMVDEGSGGSRAVGREAGLAAGASPGLQTGSNLLAAPREQLGASHPAATCDRTAQAAYCSSSPPHTPAVAASFAVTSPARTPEGLRPGAHPQQAQQAPPGLAPGLPVLALTLARVAAAGRVGGEAKERLQAHVGVESSPSQKPVVCQQRHGGGWGHGAQAQAPDECAGRSSPPSKPSTPQLPHYMLPLGRSSRAESAANSAGPVKHTSKATNHGGQAGRGCEVGPGLKAGIGTSIRAIAARYGLRQPLVPGGPPVSGRTYARIPEAAQLQRGPKEQLAVGLGVAKAGGGVAGDAWAAGVGGRCSRAAGAGAAAKQAGRAAVKRYLLEQVCAPTGHGVRRRAAALEQIRLARQAKLA